MLFTRARLTDAKHAALIVYPSEVDVLKVLALVAHIEKAKQIKAPLNVTLPPRSSHGSVVPILKSKSLSAKMKKLDAMNSANIRGAATTPRVGSGPSAFETTKSFLERKGLQRRMSAQVSRLENIAHEVEESVISSSCYLDHPPELFDDVDKVVERFGMGCFASPEVEGFNGIFRQRWQDFHVTEIDQDGCPLDRGYNFHVPSLPADWLAQCADSGKQPVASADADEDLAKPPPSEFFTVNVDDQLSKAKVQLSRRNEKVDARGKAVMPTHGLSEESKGMYLEAYLHKQRVAHGQAMSFLAQVLRVHPSCITFAGIKDLIGDTIQRVRFEGAVSPVALLQANKEFERKGVALALHHFSYKDCPLRPGDLWGNRFKIVLRDVVASKEHIDRAVDLFKKRGFPNYFGCQRFSWFGGKDDMAFAMLHNNWIAFAFRFLNYSERDFTLRQLLQREKKYPNPSQDQYRRNVVRKLRAANIEPVDLDEPIFQNCPSLYESHSVGQDAMKLSKTQRIIDILREAYLDIGLSQRRLNGQRLASFFWNQALSLRLHHFGSNEVLEGDLVIEKEYRSLTDDRGSLRDMVTIVTAENKHLFSIEDVLHPAFCFEGAKLPKNAIGGFYRQICEKHLLDWNKKHASSGLIDFVEGPRPIIRRPHDVQYTYDSEKSVLSIEFSLERGCYANVAITELLKLQQCAGSDRIMRVPLPPHFWDALGQKDHGYVTSFQDIYKGFEDGVGFVDDEHEILHRDDTSVFEIAKEIEENPQSGKRLFLAPYEDPHKIAVKWGRHNLVRNMRRRLQDTEKKKLELFEKPLAKDIGDGEVDKYVGNHFVPLAHGFNAKKIFFKVRQRQLRFPGAPRSRPRVKLGAQVANNDKRATFGSLSKKTWNVTW